MLGSVCNPDPRVRRKALDHLLACVDIMDATGSRDLKLWFSDGTNYPGQDDIRARQDRLAEALAAVHARLGPDQRMVLEYKFFEPSFYTMDVPDWGTAYLQCVAAGSEGEGRRRHRPPRAGHQHRVHRRLAAPGRPARRVRLQLALLRRRRPDGRLRRSVPAVPDHARGRARRRPRRPDAGVAFMLDQCHNIEPKIPARSARVMNVQEATAKALLVDARGAGGGPGGGRRPRRERRPDGRLRHRRATAPGRGPDRPRPRPRSARAPMPGSGYAATDRGRPGRRTAGGVGRMSVRDRDAARPSPPVVALLERSNRLGADPRNTNYAGGNTSAKGIAIDPVTGTPGRAAVGQGLRRRPRHADRGRPGRPPARSPPLARRRLSGRRARGRDGRRVRLLPPRPRRCRAVDRHRDARPRRRRPRRPPPSRLGDRPRDAPPTARR